jgi:hypothetical protein
MPPWATPAEHSTDGTRQLAAGVSASADERWARRENPEYWLSLFCFLWLLAFFAFFPMAGPMAGTGGSLFKIC